MDWNLYRNTILAQIDNEALFRSAVKVDSTHGAEAKVFCFHAAKQHDGGIDINPSMSVNLTRGTYYCATCGAKGNAHTMYKYTNGLSSDKAWLELGDALGLERPHNASPLRPDIDPGLPGVYHTNLMKQTGPIRKVLSERRGYNDATLKRFQIGWDGDRITIPIYDEFNRLVNIRRYKWNSVDDKLKVINFEDEFGNTYGEVRLYGIENLIDDDILDIVYCEGETDRIIAEQLGFATVCPTSGAGTWAPEWTKYFKRKRRVYIVQDNDSAGERATKKLCDKLFSVVDTRFITWPEDFPLKGDITDFFIKFKQTKEAFQHMLDGATKYAGVSAHDYSKEDSEALSLSLAETAEAQYKGKRIKTNVLVSGKSSTPYIVPRTVTFSCRGSFDTDDKKCDMCELKRRGGEYMKTVTAGDQALLKLFRVTDETQLKNMKTLIEVNTKCKQLDVTVSETMNISEVRLIPKAGEVDRMVDNGYVVRTGYILGKDDVETNAKYTLAGYMHNDPATQEATYLFDGIYPEKNMASKFDMDDSIHERLSLFQPKEGQSVADKIDEIHEDLERNVTNVWGRRDLAVATDLIYHTTLSFYFQEKFVKKGWAELLVIGDSGQGKSTLIEKLKNHYGLGEMLSGESSRRTGLVYNLQQTGSRWFLQWGAYPLNDGGLLIIDELSGVSEDDLALMSDVRSSGIAKANGVITAETNARTRSIFISNPRNGKQLNAETFGVVAVQKLFGKAEDIRRLDVVLSVASGDVDPDLINRRLSEVAPIPHRYTEELCNLRVLWAWSRKPDNIIIEDDALTLMLKEASKMGQRYNSKIPIVEAADQRLKIARLSIACAAMLYSTTDRENVVVKAEHVAYVVEFMHRIYSTKSLGYDKYSANENKNSDSSDDKLNDLRNKFAMLQVSDLNELISHLYVLPYFSKSHLEDFTGLDRDSLRAVMKFITSEHLVEKYKHEYRRLPLGTAFIESIIAKPISKKERNDLLKQQYGDDY